MGAWGKPEEEKKGGGELEVSQPRNSQIFAQYLEQTDKGEAEWDDEDPDDDRQNIKFLCELVCNFDSDDLKKQADTLEFMTKYEIERLYLDKGKDFDACYEYIIDFNAGVQEQERKQFHQ
mmetsp:Transcript_9648/g.16203  ORF Transcript_9648/g.16203 Transcript_9648/m.16203 type:complete len:120 (+) Transcript_9648:827-1186(+)